MSYVSGFCSVKCDSLPTSHFTCVCALQVVVRMASDLPPGPVSSQPTLDGLQSRL